MLLGPGDTNALYTSSMQRVLSNAFVPAFVILRTRSLMEKQQKGLLVHMKKKNGRRIGMSLQKCYTQMNGSQLWPR